MANSLYKIGDKVTVLSDYIDDTNSLDYSYYFTEEMLENFGGKTVTIARVEEDSEFNDYTHLELHKEEFLYLIEEDDMTHSWSAEMFQETYKNLVSQRPTIF